MKKILIIFLISLFFINITSANTWPGILQKGWLVKFDKNLDISKNVSVEKEILEFRLFEDDSNEWSKDYNYLWDNLIREYLKDKPNKLKFYENNLLNNDYYYWKTSYLADWKQSLTDTKFYLVKSPDSSNKVEIKAEYTLKNNSWNNISWNVGFSDDIPKYLWWFQIFEWLRDINFLKKLIVMPQKFNNSSSFQVEFGGEKIEYQNKAKLWKYSWEKLFYNWIKRKSDFEKNLNLYIFSDVKYFNLEFKPYETKKLTVKYIIPLESNHIYSQYLYDFSPVFYWKNNTLKSLEVKITSELWDHYEFSKKFTTFWEEFELKEWSYYLNKDNLKSRDINNFKLRFNYNYLKKENY